MDRLHSDFEMSPIAENGIFRGYGSVFDTIDSHGDTVAKGAFSDSIKESQSTGKWPAMLLQHGLGPATDDQIPIGIWTKMVEDNYGLYLQGKLAFTQRGRDLYALMKMTPRPALNGLSIGYRPTLFTMNGRSHAARRTLQSVKLVEVSLVTAPSNPLATVRRVKSISPRNDDAATKFMNALARLERTLH
jgi:HK97 family phage prohead protease